MKKCSVILLVTLISIFSLNCIYGQKKGIGQTYDVERDRFYSFRYTREYKENGDNYITIYTIYHPITNRHSHTITATNYKSEKLIVVSVDDAKGNIFSHIREEKTTYEIPSEEIFGFRGVCGELAGDRCPNQLSVGFVSDRYENVNVFEVASSRPESSNFHFFVFYDQLK